MAHEPPHDPGEIDAILASLGNTRDKTIPILQEIQRRRHHLPREALEQVCRGSDITPARIRGVSTFFNQFKHEPCGEHTIRVCVGTACYIKGAQDVLEAVREELKIPAGSDTDAARRFTVEKVACLGCCTLAPAVQIDETTFGHLSTKKVGSMIDQFLEGRNRRKGPARSRAAHEGGHGEIRIGQGSCCVAGGSSAVRDVLEDTVHRYGIRATIKQVGCVGMCHQTPLVEIVDPHGVSAFYAKVSPAEAADAVLRHFPSATGGGRLAAFLRRGITLFHDAGEAVVERHAISVRDPKVEAFLGRQKHLATENSGLFDPLSLEAYLSSGGFTALREILAKGSPESVIEAMSVAGLRGRGGAGFPTDLKWKRVRESPGADKVLMLLESYPFRVLEGILIAAFAVGAARGVLYIRAEYPLAIQRVGAALDILRERHILGARILGSSFDFDVRIAPGAGAFVCGEETALIKAVEGERGSPTFRPPFPAAQGLFGNPTLVNNVETYAAVPWIFRNGPAAFAAIGTEHSKGTKVFSLTGKVLRGGLIEVPMGTALRDIVEKIGGGVPGGKRLKAVQIGGPSGGCLPASELDTPVDFGALVEKGAIMGSGGLVVLDEDDCMVDVSRYFMSFTQRESCGKCTHCRIGTKRMLELLDALCEGKATRADLETLEKLAHSVKTGSLCGLGRTAPNPVLSTLRYFKEEVLAHVEGRCPAKKCKALIKYEIGAGCIGCTLCAQRCAAGAIEARPYHLHSIIEEKCTRCDGCRQVCPVGAVTVN
jgi:NADH:ubiquinone oxidoreductase subunit F (NADH-binding)/NADH:ubiquinone oxidoreductase subunit E